MNKAARAGEQSTPSAPGAVRVLPRSRKLDDYFGQFLV
jgi:hypothetical protein